MVQDGRPNCMKSMKLWRCVAISCIVAGPAGGFLFGILNAGDPDPNPIGRVVYAFMMAVVTPLHDGFPPNDLAGAGHSFNVWPHIAAAFLVILGWLVQREWKLSSERVPVSPK